MRKRYYRTLSLLAGLLGVLPLHVTAQENVIDEVLWTVGDEVILKSEVEEMRKNIQANGDKIDGDPYCVVPEQIAVQKLFLNQAKLDSIVVPDDQVYAYADGRINEFVNGLGSREKVEEHFGKPLHEVREEVIRSAREQFVVQKMQQELLKDLKLSPADVRRYFNRLSADSIPYVPMQVEVQIVSVNPRIPQEEIENVKSRLRDYSDRINKGEAEFSTLAILYSEDPGSARFGGELGFLGKATLAPEYAEVAFSLNDAKRASKIVQTEFGFHIIQLIERRGDRVNTRHILLKPRIDPREQQETLLRLDTLRSDILNGKISFEDAARFISQDKESRNNNGLMVNSRSEYSMDVSAKFEMGQLPQDIAREVASLQEGEISKPFIYKNERKGTETLAIVRLKKRYPGHKANPTEDFQLIKSMAEAEAKEGILHDWVQEKQQRTYVRIKEGWQKCDFRYDGWVLQ